MSVDHTDARRDSTPSAFPNSDEAAVAAIDAALFTVPVFTIDRANRKLSGHRTIAAARDSVTSGRAATWVATVRPGVVAVDIDTDDDETAWAVLHPLLMWCDDRSVWTCVRRSGGGEGRWHLFALSGTLTEALRAHVEVTRSANRLNSREVDLRATVRPLGAPHRVSGAVEVPADVEQLADELVTSWRSPGADVSRGHAREDDAPRAALAVPVAALPVTFWGDVATPHRGGDRSAVEFGHTRAMVHAGMTEDEAWSVVADGAHHGLARSRRKGRSWWCRYAWNAVERGTEVTPLAPRAGVQRTLWRGEYEWGRWVLPAAAALRTVWERWSTRERHNIDHVLAVIADRCTRSATSRVPLSLRSVVEDSGLHIDTVRGALAALCEVGIITRQVPEENTDGKRAHVYVLNVSAVDGTPSTYTPPPSDPLWLGSPAATLSAYLSTQLDPAATLTRHQHSTSLPWLSGRLHRTGATRPREGLRRWAGLRKLHAKQRQEFRAVLAERKAAAHARWEHARTVVRDRRALLDERRRGKWWAGLTDYERTERSAAQRRWFAGLCASDQAERKALLRARDAAAARARSALPVEAR